MRGGEGGEEEVGFKDPAFTALIYKVCVSGDGYCDVVVKGEQGVGIGKERLDDVGACS